MTLDDQTFPIRKTGPVDYPHLTSSQQRQLAKVETTTDGICQYAPCRVILASDDVIDRVYIVESYGYSRVWGIDPSLDKGKRSVAIEDVVTIQSSPRRLPASLANKLYAAGESGMGYTLFVVVMRDGSRLPFVCGNAVDFPNWPDGIDPREAVDVLPHAGRDIFRDRAPDPTESSAEYAWCLYGGPEAPRWLSIRRRE
jgi:hypothetical protein